MQPRLFGNNRWALLSLAHVAGRQDVLRVKREHALAAEQRRHYDAEQQEYNIQRSQQVRKEQQQFRERRRLEQVRSSRTASAHSRVPIVCAGALWA